MRSSRRRPFILHQLKFKRHAYFSCTIHWMSRQCFRIQMSDLERMPDICLLTALCWPQKGYKQANLYCLFFPCWFIQLLNLTWLKVSHDLHASPMCFLMSEKIVRKKKGDAELGKRRAKTLRELEKQPIIMGSRHGKPLGSADPDSAMEFTLDTNCRQKIYHAALNSYTIEVNGFRRCNSA